MNPDSKIEGYKMPDLILPYGSTGEASSGMSQRELVIGWQDGAHYPRATQ